MSLTGFFKRILLFLIEYGLFIIILVIGYYIWSMIFDAALIDYLESDRWNYRYNWLGNGDIELFGYTVQFQFEGYSDYTFYYVHWGHNMLRGVMPYCGEFGYLKMDGYVNENGLYIFPPLTAVFYAIGIAIDPAGNWGIGLVLAIFGFLTVFPVYGIAKELSGNGHVGEAAALTYLLNPSVLFHTLYLWMNPAPFIFFWFSGFYMLVRGNRHAGTLLIVTAALFKQTAWFMGIPLVVYLLLRSRGDTEDANEQSEIKTELEQDEDGSEDETNLTQEEEKGRMMQAIIRINELLDLRNFAISVIVVLVFVVSIIYPFYLAQPQMLDHLALGAGGFPLESFTELPNYPSPMRLQVLAVLLGLPELAQLLDLIVFYGFLLSFGVILFAGLIFMVPKKNNNMNFYFRRILFLTMFLMLWVHLAGPRGVYKYYFVLFAPFFSILSSEQMVTSSEERVPFSLSMLYMPICLSLMIIIPSRNVYFFGVILIFVSYYLASQIGMFYSVIKLPEGFVKKRITLRMEPALNHYRKLREKFSTWLKIT
jgi:hypothetical protein